MMAGEPSDDEALWRFSLAFYARPGVSEALIALQDRAGLRRQPDAVSRYGSAYPDEAG